MLIYFHVDVTTLIQLSVFFLCIFYGFIPWHWHIAKSLYIFISLFHSFSIWIIWNCSCRSSFRPLSYIDMCFFVRFQHVFDLIQFSIRRERFDEERGREREGYILLTDKAENSIFLFRIWLKHIYHVWCLNSSDTFLKWNRKRILIYSWHFTQSNENITNRAKPNHLLYIS